jgi:hypothetical protein
MFFLPEDKARETLIQIDVAFRSVPLTVEDRCIISLQFPAVHEAFGAHYEAFEAAAHKPELVPFAYHPWQLLFEMLSRLEAKLENLEKKVIKS